MAKPTRTKLANMKVEPNTTLYVYMKQLGVLLSEGFRSNWAVESASNILTWFGSLLTSQLGLAESFVCGNSKALNFELSTSVSLNLRMKLLAIHESPLIENFDKYPLHIMDFVFFEFIALTDTNYFAFLQDENGEGPKFNLEDKIGTLKKAQLALKSFNCGSITAEQFLIDGLIPTIHALIFELRERGSGRSSSLNWFSDPDERVVQFCKYCLKPVNARPDAHYCKDQSHKALYNRAENRIVDGHRYAGHLVVVSDRGAVSKIYKAKKPKTYFGTYIVPSSLIENRLAH